MQLVLTLSLLDSVPAVECDCCQGRRVCLHHATNLCGCEMRQRRLVYRHSLRQLEAVQAGKQAPHCGPWSLVLSGTSHVFGSMADLFV